MTLTAINEEAHEIRTAAVMLARDGWSYRRIARHLKVELGVIFDAVDRRDFTGLLHGDPPFYRSALAGRRR